MERVKGIEPSSFGWEPKALPLSYTRDASLNTRRCRRTQATRRQTAAQIPCQMSGMAIERYIGKIKSPR